MDRTQRPYDRAPLAETALAILGAVTFAFVVLMLVGAIVFFGRAAAAHNWYRGMKHPDTGRLCCGTYDCQAVPHRELPRGRIEVHVNGGWHLVPLEAIHPVPSPDGAVHACWRNRQEGDTPKFICVFREGLGA